MSRDIFALLVGINDYSPDVGKLTGSLADVEHFHGYLTDNFDQSRLHIEVLKDADATRPNIIEQFRSHLQEVWVSDLVFGFRIVQYHDLLPSKGNIRNSLGRLNDPGKPPSPQTGHLAATIENVPFVRALSEQPACVLGEQAGSQQAVGMEDRVELGELVLVVQLGQEHAVHMVRRLLAAVEPDLGVVADNGPLRRFGGVEVVPDLLNGGDVPTWASSGRGQPLPP